MSGVLRFGDSIYFYNSVELKDEQQSEQLDVAGPAVKGRPTQAVKAVVHGFLGAKG
jgi:hypothetical protein